MKKILTLLSLLAPCLLSAQAISHKEDVAQSLNLFNSLFKEVQLNYVDSLDAKKAINTAITYMLDEIDPYTEYYPSEETETLSRIATGEYGGVGSIINKGRNGLIRFSEPMAGTPSRKAGILAGDIILRIDSVEITKEHTVAQVSDLLRGTPGTRLRVKIQRPYSADSIREVVITREKIRTPAVPFAGLTGPDKKTGYISISSFTDKAPSEVKEAVQQMLSQGMTSLVIDLQGNPGGLLESAVEIAELFVPRGTEIVRTRGRDASSERVYKTTHKPIAPNLPLAILLDGSSASSSEILAGALQDLDRAVIVGERSFGKGLVQSSRSLPYDAMVKITVAKYYIPSGRLIQAIDYSHRNPDGSVARTPDSLTTVYHTLHGREVRDGGGITPDVKIAPQQNNRILYSISLGSFDLDYATKFASEHPSIAPADQFVITDSIFADFKQFIRPGELTYENAYAKTLEALKETVEREGYMTDEISAQIASLEALLATDTDRDLDRNREAISFLLSDAIVQRYYDRQGAIESTLWFNKPLQKAIELLSSDQYNTLLGK